MPKEKKKKFFKLVYKKIKKRKKNDKIIKKLIYFKTIPFLFNMDNISISISKLFRSSKIIMIEQIESKISQLKGDFILKKNNYEKEFCDILNWSCINHRYYDATNGFSYIELKKGQSGMWFDMVRYAEIFLKIGTQHTVTLFINYSKKECKILEIYVISTSRILDFLKLDKQKAEHCIELYKNVPRGLNMQASATKKDLREIAYKIIKF